MRYLPPRKFRIVTLLGILVGVIAYNFSALAGSNNGFDLSNSIIPAEQILHGGPPRDGIPALTNPKLIAASRAGFLQPDDRVVGITLGDKSRAYPIKILNWHEIVNDVIDDRHFAITYCPLCGTAVAFDANIDGDTTSFGVSGLLYNSDVLLYDRDTESLWSQIMGRSVAGKRVGKQLTALPISHTTWRDGRNRHPDTLVLSEDTGYSRNYNRNPYAGYETSRGTYFAVNHRAPDNYHPKEIVLGLNIGGVYKAYPFVELEKLGKVRFADTLNGESLRFDWDSKNRHIKVFDSSGTEVVGTQGFWFAWFAFHPDTRVFKAQQS